MTNLSSKSISVIENKFKYNGKEEQGEQGLNIYEYGVRNYDRAPHEVGHLLGLDDRYACKNGPNKGWETNIMGSSQTGKVEQKNIDGILGDAMKAY